MAAAAQLPAWKQSDYQFMRALGVDQPYIGEISPMQYGLLSKAGKRRYDAKRSAEWTAAGEAKARWRREVIAAYDAGEITLKTPGIHREAVKAIEDELYQRQKAAAAEAERAALVANDVKGPADVKAGDPLWDVFARAPVTVTKVFTTRVRVRPEAGAEYSRPYYYFQRRSALAEHRNTMATKKPAPADKAPATKPTKDPRQVMQERIRELQQEYESAKEDEYQKSPGTGRPTRAEMRRFEKAAQKRKEAARALDAAELELRRYTEETARSGARREPVRAEISENTMVGAVTPYYAEVLDQDGLPFGGTTGMVSGESIAQLKDWAREKWGLDAQGPGEPERPPATAAQRQALKFSRPPSNPFGEPARAFAWLQEAGFVAESGTSRWTHPDGRTARVVDAGYNRFRIAMEGPPAPAARLDELGAGPGVVPDQAVAVKAAARKASDEKKAKALAAREAVKAKAAQRAQEAQKKRAAAKLARDQRLAERSRQYPPLEWQRRFWVAAEILHPDMVWDERARAEVWPSIVKLWRVHKRPPEEAAQWICRRCEVEQSPRRPTSVASEGRALLDPVQAVGPRLRGGSFGMLPYLGAVPPSAAPAAPAPAAPAPAPAAPAPAPAAPAEAEAIFEAGRKKFAASVGDSNAYSEVGAGLAALLRSRGRDTTDRAFWDRWHDPLASASKSWTLADAIAAYQHSPSARKPPRVMLPNGGRDGFQEAYTLLTAWREKLAMDARKAAEEEARSNGVRKGSKSYGPYVEKAIPRRFAQLLGRAKDKADLAMNTLRRWLQTTEANIYAEVLQKAKDVRERGMDLAALGLEARGAEFREAAERMEAAVEERQATNAENLKHLEALQAEMAAEMAPPVPSAEVEDLPDDVPLPKVRAASAPPVAPTPALVVEPFTATGVRPDKSDGHIGFYNDYEIYLRRPRQGTGFTGTLYFAPAENPVVGGRRSLGAEALGGEYSTDQAHRLLQESPPAQLKAAAKARILRGGALPEALRRVAWSMSHDQTRPRMYGVLLAPDGVVCTNGHTLAWWRFDPKWPALYERKAGPLLPSPFVEAVLKQFKGPTAEIGTFQRPGSFPELFIRDSVSGLRLINFQDYGDEFPPYRQVVQPTDGGTTFKIERAAFLAKVRAGIAFLTQKGGTGKSEQVEQQWRSEGCPGAACKVMLNLIQQPDGPGTRVKVPAKAPRALREPHGFQSSYIEDAVAAAPQELLSITVHGALDPMRIDAGAYTAVLMPRRL